MIDHLPFDNHRKLIYYCNLTVTYLVIDTPMSEPKITIWEGCYDESLKGLVTPESFSHPAKMSRALCERIFDHGKAMNYWKEGDTIVDPFGGIFTTGLVGAYRKYRVIGCELEPKFADLAQANIELNRRKLEMLGRPIPVIVRGDSRELRKHIAEIIGAVTSPPYVGGGHHPDQTGSWGGLATKKGMGTKDVAGYGQEDGQIGQMQEGDHATVVGSVTSPPFSMEQPCASQTRNIKDYTAFTRGNGTKLDHSMESDGNLAAMPTGEHATVVGAISSPPYAGISPEAHSSGIDLRKNYETYRKSGGGSSWEKFVASRQKHQAGYGNADGQLGALPEGDHAQIVGAITSPPFAGNSGGTGEASSAPMNAKYPGVFERHLGSMRNGAGYGDTDGQINAMPEGDVEAVKGAITSPPYNLPMSQDHNGSKGGTRGTTPSETGAFVVYGNTPGQIEGLAPGEHAGVVGGITSPPYSGKGDKGDSTLPERDRKRLERLYPERVGNFRTAFRGSATYGDEQGQIGRMNDADDDHAKVVGALTSPPWERTVVHDGGPVHQQGGDLHADYGKTDGQIGNEQADTYWASVCVIYQELYALLPSGGAVAIVVKDYIRNKERVPLCTQTAELLEAVGFRVIERCHAMLVKEQPLPVDMFTGEAGVKKTERKSFFRRIYEKKNPDKTIDFEEVIWAIKP